MEFDHLKTYKRFLGDALPKSILDNLDDRMRAVKKGTSAERFPELVDMTRCVIQDFFDELPDSGQLDLFQTIGDLVYYMELATFIGPELCGAKRRRFIELFRQVDVEGLTQNPTRIIFGKLSGKHLEPIFAELRELVKETVTGWDENRSRENANFLEVVMRECTKDGVVDWDAVFWDVYTMVIAGQANTYVTAGWLLFYYETKPHIRAKILAELSAITPFGEPHKMISQFNRMIYTEQSIREIVRLSMGFIEFRSTPRDMTFESDAYNFQIPKDSLIVFVPITLHMRDDLFPEARKFAPERHKLNKDGGLESTMVRDCKLTVWGCGRHPCPGLRLANLQLPRCADEDDFVVHDDLSGLHNREQRKSQDDNKVRRSLSYFPNHGQVPQAQPQLRSAPLM
ncbi:cytochrome P450 [Endogone sp. FLAS-F59071]|nr:cytochrome P450 [Endogone sp. FLAS-F59071]|eukprot:RUS22051.1 cytochrome P450 [Endogone sp. FLAS-F59071]